MRLTDIQMAGLRCAASGSSVEYKGPFEHLFTLGKIAGKAELACELLQEARDRGLPADETCTMRETPGACRCATCTNARNFIDEATR